MKTELTYYELAYLTGIKSRVFFTLIVQLIEAGVLIWDVERKMLIKQTSNYLSLTIDEQKVADAIVSNDAGQISKINLVIENRVKRNLKRRGIRDLSFLERLFFFLCAMAIPIIAIAAAIDMPFGLLWVLPAIYLSSWVVIGISKVLTFLAGEGEKQRIMAAFRQQTPASSEQPNFNLTRAYALYGSIILENCRFHGLADYLNPSRLLASNRKDPNDPDYDLCESDKPLDFSWGSGLDSDCD